MRLSSAALIGLIGFLLPADAMASPTWLPATTLSAPGKENYPADLAVAADGTAIAVWQRASCMTGNDTHPCENGKVQYTVRPPGGVFSPPADMKGDPFASNSAQPHVAVDAAGNAIAAWISGGGETARVKYALRPAGGDFGGAKTVPDSSGSFHSFPDLAIAPNGRAVITFGRLVEADNRASYSIREPGGDFGAAEVFPGDPGTTLNQSPSIHLDGAGGGIANWTSSSAGVFVRYAVLSPGSGDFGSAVALDKGAGAQLAIAPSGAAVMIWGKYNSAFDMRYSFRPPGGSFQAPITFVEPASPLGPRVAIAADGSAVASWSALVAPKSYVRWAAAPPGGPFGPPTAVDPGVDGTVEDLTMSEQGTALLLWANTAAAPKFELRAALRPSGGAFGTPVPLPGPPQGVNLHGGATAFDSQGNAVAIWTGLDPSTASEHDVPLLAAGLDAAGPRIETLDVPLRARDDRRATLRIAASDVWSPVVGTGFDFGDGFGAPGPEAVHRFRAGLRHVTATATDAVGNASTAVRDVRVADRTRPSIKGLRVAPRRFSVLRRRVAHASRSYGATIHLRLSERAAVRFVVQRGRRGVRVRVGSQTRCLPPTPQNRRRGHRRCTRFKRERRFNRRNLRAGVNRLRFSGRIRGRPLPPGRHRLVAVAVDGAGHRSKPARTGFRVRSS